MWVLFIWVLFLFPFSLSLSPLKSTHSLNLFCSRFVSTSALSLSLSDSVCRQLSFSLTIFFSLHLLSLIFSGAIFISMDCFLTSAICLITVTITFLHFSNLDCLAIFLHHIAHYFLWSLWFSFSPFQAVSEPLGSVSASASLSVSLLIPLHFCFFFFFSSFHQFASGVRLFSLLRARTFSIEISMIVHRFIFCPIETILKMFIDSGVHCFCYDR